MKEKTIQKAIVDYLNYNGCYVWSVNAGKIKIQTATGTRFFMGAPTGHSDIQGIHKATGRFIAIEVKTPERRRNVSSAQQEFLDMVAICNGISGVATSQEEALEIITKFLNSRT